jgi:hypothetical protein
MVVRWTVARSTSTLRASARRRPASAVVVAVVTTPRGVAVTAAEAVREVAGLTAGESTSFFREAAQGDAAAGAE